MPKIVIVEDEQLLLKAYSIQLLSSGFQVLSALDGQSGLELIRKEKPDLVLLDINLPRVSGFGVLEKLKADPELSHIPVIILSGISQKEEELRAFRLGAVDYFIKANTDLAVLTNKIQSVLKQTV